MIACILPGPKRALRTEREEPRWCFGERRRLPGTWTLQDYDPESPHYGWYEPIWTYRCDGGDHDCRLFGSGRW